MIFTWRIVASGGLPAGNEGNVIVLATALAGNLFVFSSLVNVAVARSAGRAGEKIGFVQFVKYGIPVTVISYAVLLAWVSMTT